ncbi:MAG: thioredoxin family protein [Patescibacteria group bacterium]|jgi:small redox-active disulfide protein 2
MIIKILGSGCPNCKKLEANTEKALANLGLVAKIEKVTDFAEIMAYGVLGLPAIVIDEELKSFGRVLKTEEIEKIIK